jgi:hypothetical protein
MRWLREINSLDRPDRYQFVRLEASTISKYMGAWIAECSVLRYLGMPDGAYTLLFDGDPTPE